jgi:hypothetical protein
MDQAAGRINGREDGKLPTGRDLHNRPAGALQVPTVSGAVEIADQDAACLQAPVLCRTTKTPYGFWSPFSGDAAEEIGVSCLGCRCASKSGRSEGFYRGRSHGQASES